MRRDGSRSAGPSKPVNEFDESPTSDAPFGLGRGIGPLGREATIGRAFLPPSANVSPEARSAPDGDRRSSDVVRTPSFDGRSGNASRTHGPASRVLRGGNMAAGRSARPVPDAVPFAVASGRLVYGGPRVADAAPVLAARDDRVARGDG